MGCSYYYICVWAFSWKEDIVSDKRRDSKGRLLKQGERQREDGKYEYRYYDEKGGRHSVYSWRLVDTDRIPPGKRDAESLRSMEKRIRRDLED